MSTRALRGIRPGAQDLSLVSTRIPAQTRRAPEKSSGLLRADGPVAERCAVIDAEKSTYPVAWMCRLLGVPRSSFYAWRNRAESASAARRRRSV